MLILEVCHLYEWLTNVPCILDEHNVDIYVMLLQYGVKLCLVCQELAQVWTIDLSLLLSPASTSWPTWSWTYLLEVLSVAKDACVYRGPPSDCCFRAPCTCTDILVAAAGSSVYWDSERACCCSRSCRQRCTSLLVSVMSMEWSCCCSEALLLTSSQLISTRLYMAPHARVTTTSPEFSSIMAPTWRSLTRSHSPLSPVVIVHTWVSPKHRPAFHCKHEKHFIYTVNHKKGGSTFVIITLENLDGF